MTAGFKTTGGEGGIRLRHFQQVQGSNTTCVIIACVYAGFKRFFSYPRVSTVARRTLQSTLKDA